MAKLLRIHGIWKVIFSFIVIELLLICTVNQYEDLEDFKHTPVCRKAWMSIHGYSKYTMDKASSVIKEGSTLGVRKFQASSIPKGLLYNDIADIFDNNAADYGRIQRI